MLSLKEECENGKHQLYLIDLKNFIKKLSERFPNNFDVNYVCAKIILKISKDQDVVFWNLERRIKGECEL